MHKADFDHIADQYDRDFSDTLIGKAQRKLVWDILSRYYTNFNKLKVLEVNCGTGVDAEGFAENGATILATDISPKMVDVTSKRLSNYSNASAEVLDLKSSSSIQGSFDLIFSNFGGLNCLTENELRQFINEVHSKLATGGKLMLVIMPKNTIWEMLYFSSKASPMKALRRMKKGGLEANVEGKKVKTYYYNPSFFQQFNNYNIESISPIGLYVPPSYLEPRFKKKAHKIDRYYHKDHSKFNSPSLAKFADHYCIVLQKK